ncbi:MAG: hypothetical protein QM627_02340 [Luteolibacter sp.]
MKPISLIAILFTSISSLVSAVEYKIEHVSRGKQWAWVDDAWNKGAECIELKISASEKQEPKQVYYKAYFYDKDDNLIYSASQPSHIYEYGEANVFVPPALEAGKRYSVYFAVPKAHASGTKKWRRVIVVFGDREKAVAELFPKGEIKPYDFPEKSKVK